MTLIVAGVAEPFALVAADRRVSVGTHAVDDDYNKLTALFAADAKVVVSFTGLAKAGSFDTAEWISSTLVNKADFGRCLVPLCERLMSYLETQVAEINATPAQKRLTLLVTGYRYDSDDPDEVRFVEPILWRISNFEMGDKVASQAAPVFEFEEVRSKASNTNSPYWFTTAGTTKSLVPQQVAKLEQLLQEHRPSRAVASKALDIGLEAARSTAAKNSIGTRWNSAIILQDPRAPIWIQYHAPTPTVEHFGTTLVNASAGDQPVLALGNLMVETTEPHAHAFPGTARNALCPCGSGLRYHACHGHPSAAKGGWFLNRLLAEEGDDPMDGTFVKL